MFAAVAVLEELLTELNFTTYAEYKAQGNPVFADYPKFAAVLQAIADLRCKALCFEGGNKSGCPVRLCAKENNFAGCWECGSHAECERLAPLRANHPDLGHNLAMIREHGPDRWAPHRGRHYRWDKAPRDINP